MHTADQLIKDKIRSRFEESVANIHLTGEHLAGKIAQAAEMIVASLSAGGGLFIFGNGGSAADAQHIAGELVGRFLAERQALRAEALSTDTSVLTCVANDYDYASIFSRQLEGKARGGDVALALSTSGNSPNILAALTAARKIGMKTIALTGSGGGQCALLADILLDVPYKGKAPRIQEAHTVIYHVLCELVEAAFVK